MTDASHMLRRFARNNAWSNARLHRACAELGEAEYRAERVSFFPSIHLTLNHILTVDWYYFGCLTDDAALRARAQSDEPFADLAPLTAAQHESDRALVAFADALTTPDLDRLIVTERAGGRRPQERVSDVLMHLFQHDIHHRGQVHAMLSGTSVAPPQLDEFFLEQDAPLRAGEMDGLD